MYNTHQVTMHDQFLLSLSNTNKFKTLHWMLVLSKVSGNNPGIFQIQNQSSIPSIHALSGSHNVTQVPDSANTNLASTLAIIHWDITA